MVTFIKSVIIGICAILPGISGSVIAISFKIYDRFIESVSSIRNIKKNSKFIILVVIGGVCGIILASNFVIYFFKYEIIIYYILTGIILSELPFLIKKIHDYSGNKLKVKPLVIAFVFSMGLDVINCRLSLFYNEFSYFIGGILFSFGKIFPGISSSFFLISLGIYEKIILLISNPLLLFNDFLFYFPFILGAIIGIIFFYKLLSYLLKYKFELTYSMIIGFIISSVIILIPKFKLDSTHVIGVLLMISTFVIFIYIKAKNDS